jgi:hypothetical protein
MHFMPKRAEVEGHEPRPDEQARATRDDAGQRRAAVRFLEAAAATEDQETRKSLRCRAAELLSPSRRP